MSVSVGVVQGSAGPVVTVVGRTEQWRARSPGGQVLRGFLQARRYPWLGNKAGNKAEGRGQFTETGAEDLIAQLEDLRRQYADRIVGR